MKKRLFFFCAFLLSCSIVLYSEGELENRDYTDAREVMVSRQIQARDVSDPAVLAAMRNVPRHLFMPENVRNQAYEDHPVPIGEGQTISQPYIVALMTASLGLTEKDRVLEIGTGSGYQAAILAMIVREVYTIEIKEVLCERAGEILHTAGFEHVKTKCADGYDGWEEYAPFDCIMITAAVDHIPIPLFRQLKDGGRLILPLGNPYSYQELVLVTKKGKDYTIKKICGVLFVPMTGKAIESQEE
jgi:protein-L-isoaspartate(D-aspartate) O-methyltransferase